MVPDPLHRSLPTRHLRLPHRGRPLNEPCHRLIDHPVVVDNGYGIWSAFANDEFLERLRLNHRALAVEWTIGPESVARTRHDRRLLAGHRGMRLGPWIRK